MKEIPHYCQNCGKSNTLGEQSCQHCGTRLMIVVFPPSIRHDESVVPSYYEDHLLERVTLLENRLTQVAERLGMALDLMLRQTKTTQSDHILLETLIDSLNTIGSVGKEGLIQKWQKRLEREETDKNFVNRLEIIFEVIWTHPDNPKEGLFSNLVMEGMKFLLEDEDKQSLRVLERASRLAPKNVPLLIFVAESLYRVERLETAVEYLQKALNLQPRKEKARFLLGVIYAESYKMEQSRQLLNQLPMRIQKSFCLQYICGFSSAIDEDWQNALKIFKKIAEDHDLPEINYLLGCAYFQIGKYKLALRSLQKAIEVDAKFADAWFMLSVVYTHIENGTESQKASEMAWSAGETGAQCLEFVKNRKQVDFQTALPFLPLKSMKKNPLTGCSLRLSKLIKEEIFKTLDNLK